MRGEHTPFTRTMIYNTAQGLNSGKWKFKGLQSNLAYNDSGAPTLSACYGGDRARIGNVRVYYTVRDERKEFVIICKICRGEF